jgi:phosphoserine phosphatase RsbU/P
MEAAVVQDLGIHARHQLLQRRQRLERVIADAPEEASLTRLLEQVDAALGRIEHGTFGVCDVCHGAVEADRIAADPLLRTCLDCLSAAEQRALERDLDLARDLQRTLLPPSSFRADGWEGAYRYEPAGSAGGDYVDLLPLDSGELFFVIGDVSGKGLAASMLMTHLHATLRSLVALQLPFGELMERANRIFFGSVGGQQYATLLAGKASPGGEVELSNAGHCPPILLRESGAATLPPTSVPIGLFANAPFPTERLTLGVGDDLLVYTDGITEAVDASGREYGRDRLAAGALGRRHLAAQDLVSDSLADLAAFRGASPRQDDQTLFVLRRRA